MQPELPEKLKLHTVSGIPLFNGKGPGHKQHINDGLIIPKERFSGTCMLCSALTV